MAWIKFTANIGTSEKCGREHPFPKAFNNILFSIQFIGV